MAPNLSCCGNYMCTLNIGSLESQPLTNRYTEKGSGSFPCSSSMLRKGLVVPYSSSFWLLSSCGW